MYINPEKYAVMAQYLENECVHQSFLSKHSNLDGSHRFQIMADNIDEALIFRDYDGAFKASYKLYPWNFKLSEVWHEVQ